MKSHYSRKLNKYQIGHEVNNPENILCVCMIHQYIGGFVRELILHAILLTHAVFMEWKVRAPASASAYYNHTESRKFMVPSAESWKKVASRLYSLHTILV